MQRRDELLNMDGGTLSGAVGALITLIKHLRH